MLCSAAKPRDMNHKAVTRCNQRGVLSDEVICRRRSRNNLVRATTTSEQVQSKDQVALVMRYVEKAMKNVQKCRVHAAVMGSWMVLRSSR